ncbi:MAG: multicopper oxidase family protein [Myxococcales bacterium]
MLRLILAVAAVCTLSMAACSGEHAGHGTPAVRKVPFREAGLSLPRAVDLNPDPTVVEVRLEARPSQVALLEGTQTPAWTYDGHLPGPLIEARVGDRLIVHFTNALPEPTTIHWHGVRVPAEMDGTTRMQQPIAPGGTFRYEFTLLDAGLYWYHPHHRSHEQVEKGLYGVLLVRGEDAVDAPERVLVLDDVLVGDDGQPLAPTDGDEMMGREGNLVLVNGRAAPAVTVAPGSWERWRVVNASNARYYALALPGHALVQIGSDGGWLTAPERRDTILLTPGERLDLLVHFDRAPGTTARLTSRAHTRGHAVTIPEVELLEVRYGDGPAQQSPSPVPARLAQITPLAPGPAVRRFVLSEEDASGEHAGHGGGSGRTVFRINGEAFPNITPVRVALGDVETWELVNDSGMDHPFHLHGYFFQPLTVAGAAQPLQWKDTVNLPPRSTTRVAVAYTDYAGSFMYHCHILEHAEHGMMGELEVTAR